MKIVIQKLKMDDTNDESENQKAQVSIRSDLTIEERPMQNTQTLFPSPSDVQQIHLLTINDEVWDTLADRVLQASWVSRKPTSRATSFVVLRWDGKCWWTS